MFKIFSTGVLISTILLSCGSLPNNTPSEQPSLMNSQWRLDDTVKGKIPTMVLEYGKVSGNAGCNNYFGTLSVDAKSAAFSVKNIGATKMYCDEMSTEQNFLMMLPKADRYKISGNILELYQNNLLLLKFKKIQ